MKAVATTTLTKAAVMEGAPSLAARICPTQTRPEAQQQQQQQQHREDKQTLLRIVRKLRKSATDMKKEKMMTSENLELETEEPGSGLEGGSSSTAL
ncbi:hypothetical protein PG997_013670 [Apiospora hydei]|uniref:Uncharacterized protein n=1 Tax=Apiospora hydei TaxID=1337664 RepID=A0ABR1V6X4_9PEZI